MGMLSVIKTLPKTIKHGKGAIMFALKKGKPQILVGVGTAVAVGGFIWAVINARKMNDTIAESEQKVNDIQEQINELADKQEEVADYDRQMKELKKDLNKAKADAIWKMFLLIGIPTIVFAGGLCISVGGHVIMVRRFGEVSASLAALQQTFDRYRAMNIEEHGEECDRRYRYGIVGEKEVEATVTDENGNEQQVKCTVPVTSCEGASLYSFVFSEEFSRKCPKDPVSTISFLRSQERYWNIWMQTKQKPVTLYMVLEDLGIELDPDDPMNDYIMIAGWRPNGDGDNQIDFGIMRAINKKTINMEENIVMLNFNCDGNLYHSTRYTKDGKKVC